MRYPASEKLAIIHLVEQSHLSVRQTLEKLGISEQGPILRVLVGPVEEVHGGGAGPTVPEPQLHPTLRLSGAEGLDVGQGKA